MEWEATHKEYLKSLKSEGFTKEGWIDSAGNFWPVDYFESHELVASLVLDCDEATAEKHVDQFGWLRLSDYGDRTAAKALNQKQINTLFDYCMALDYDFKRVNEGILFF